MCVRDFLFIYSQVLYQSILLLYTKYSITNTFLMYISIMALGQHTMRTRRSAMLRLRRKRLVEDLIDLEVRMTMRTRTFPTTPTARTRLKRTKLV